MTKIQAGGGDGSSGGGAVNSFLRSLNSARDKATLERTVNNMWQILVAAQLYANDHGGKLPVNFPEDLRPYVDGDFAGILADERAPGEKVGYVWLVSPQTTASALKNPS